MKIINKVLKKILKMDKIIEVKNLTKTFWINESRFSKKVAVKALNNICLYINKQEILGLVGESGCGKSTCGKVILGIIRPDSGKTYFKGEETTFLHKKYLLKFRGKMMIIYQDPYGSLDPQMTAENIIGEPLFALKNISKDAKDEKKAKIVEMMKKVGLNENKLNDYPHEFSGGQKQRISIARALITNPEFIVADEPVSALDVSIQAQIINLLRDLYKEFKLSMLFISHDLGVIRHISHRVIVMYLGEIFETANRKELFDNPKHPYTIALINAIPTTDPKYRSRKNLLKGDISSYDNLSESCNFCPRCIFAIEKCRKEKPRLINVGNNHFVACHLFSS